jgi:ubiquinone/menaquinone biosynthesis C-methylase UbiE
MPLSQRVYWQVRPWLTPGLQNSHISYARTLQRLANASTRWLDVGCGHAFVPEWAPLRLEPSPTRRIVGVDPDAQALRHHADLTCGIVASGEALPFSPGSFDLVTMNMVLEHVEHPERLFSEVFRVLEPGGVLLAHTPNARGYTTALTRLGPPRLRVMLAGVLQGRAAADVYPTFYRANTAPVLRRLATRAGFLECAIDYVESSPLFANFPPLLLPEMVFIRAARWLRIRSLRPCLLTILHKPASSHGVAERTTCQGADIA